MTHDVPLRRAGRTHPVTILHEGDRPLAGALVDDGRPLEVDAALAEAGRAHLERLRAASPGIWNGPILGLRHVDGGVVRAGRTDYFTMLATADALTAEDPLVLPAARGPLRRRVHELAGGDPWRRGDGRASVVGVTMLVVMGDGQDARLLLGRRRDDLAVAPSLLATFDGCTEATDHADPLTANAWRELTEEVPAVAGRVADAGGLEACARLMGITCNLVRFSPSLCVEVRVPHAPAGGPPELEAAEFTRAVTVPATPDGLRRLWAGELGPLAPPAAGALALWERRAFR